MSVGYTDLFTSIRVIPLSHYHQENAESSNHVKEIKEEERVVKYM